MINLGTEVGFRDEEYTIGNGFCSRVWLMRRGKDEDEDYRTGCGVDVRAMLFSVEMLDWGS